MEVGIRSLVLSVSGENRGIASCPIPSFPRPSGQGWNRLENRKPVRSGRLKNATGPVRPVN
jgi:hypothetical protein